MLKLMRCGSHGKRHFTHFSIDLRIYAGCSVHCKIGGTKGPRGWLVHEAHSAECTDVSEWPMFNTLWPRRNRRHFADDIFTCILLNENVLIPIKI